ncbi:hypothetical protein ACEPAG_7482 [Sanghuangporus baumii]
MALPSLKDLLPDHLFYNVPPSTDNYFVPPPLPPTSATLLPSQPLYPQDNSVSFSSHQTQQQRFPSRPTQPAFEQASVSDPPHPVRPEPNIGGSLALSDLERTRFIFDDPSLQISDNGQNDPVDPYWSDDGNNDALDHNRQESSGSNDRVKKHTCQTCGKGFNRPSSLRIHANTHSGAKPYVCPFPLCGRTFNVSSNMRRHYRNHSTRAPAPLPPLQFNGTDRIPLPANSWGTEPQSSQTFVQSGHRVSTGIPPLPHVSATPQAIDIYRTGPYMERFGSAMLGAEAAARAAWRAENSVRGQLARTAGPHVQYEYPCPPLSTGSESAEALYPVTRASHYAVHQPQLDGPNPAGAEALHEDIGTYSLQDHHLPSAFPPSLPPAHVPTPGHRSTPSYTQENFDAPLTPPHTNEASLSPPLRARSRAPHLGDERCTSRQVHLTTYTEESGHDGGHSAHLLLSPDAVGYNQSSSDYVPISRHADLLLGAISDTSADEDRKRRRDEAKGVVMEQKTEVRQQPSPDTPSFHVSELHSDGLESRSSEKADNATVLQKNEAGEDIRICEEMEVTRRSSLSLKDILHDVQEPHTRETTTLSTQSHQIPSGDSTLSTTLSGSALPREMPNSALAIESRDSESRSKKQALGTTPGAAPPPPYPLYSLPPADVADDTDRATRKAAGKVESARPKKKRRRR